MRFLDKAGRISVILPGAVSLRRASLCVLVLLAASACALGTSPPYVTSYASTLAPQLGARPRLCIVSYAVDPLLRDSSGAELDTMPGPVEVSLAKKEAKRALAREIATALAAQHLEQIVRTFSERFELVGETGTDIVAFETVSDTARLAARTATCGAGLGLAVEDRYGWDWDPENTGPQFYFFRSCVKLLNAEGVIWSFCGKGAMTPAVKFSLKGFVSGVVGVAPPVDEVVEQYALQAEYFPQLLLRLIQEDAQGTPHGSSLSDYFGDTKAVRRLSVDSSGDRVRVPIW